MKKRTIIVLVLLVSVALSSYRAVGATSQVPPDDYDWKSLCPTGITLRVVPVDASLIFLCGDSQLICNKKSVVSYSAMDGGGALSLCGVGGLQLDTTLKKSNVDWKGICPAKLRIDVQPLNDNALLFRCLSNSWTNVCKKKALVAYTSGDIGGSLVMCGF